MPTCAIIGVVEREPTLPSERVAEALRQRITSGELRPGQRLPTTGELAAEHHVSRATVVRAVSILVNEGLVITRRRWGAWVAGQSS
jgi:DNA-binding GntR family transcriptional regulator